MRDRRRRLAALVAIPVVTAAVSWLVEGWALAVATTALAILVEVAIGFWGETGAVLPWRRRKPGRGRVTPREARLVDRPEQRESVVARLLRPGGREEVFLLGPSGFGKTALAYLIADDRRVQRAFAGGRWWMTLGEGLAGAELAQRINDLSEHLTGTRPQYADPEEAGRYLSEELSRGRAKLLILDDVWTPGQLEPFRQADCARLVTTRKSDLVRAFAAVVEVSQVSVAQAREIIQRDLAAIPDDVATGLIRATGRWAFLLGKVNARLHTAVRRGGDLDSVARDTLERLRGGGPAALDVRVNRSRSNAVRATILLSISQLPEGSGERLLELGIFADHDRIPVDLVALLWLETAGLTAARAHELIEALSELSLVDYRPGDDAITLHDVLRDYLRFELGHESLARVNSALLSGLARTLPGEPGATEWWRLPDELGYLWRHLPYHLVTAGQVQERDTVVTDLRWISTKLRLFGPAAAAADLDAPRSEALLKALRRGGPLPHAEPAPGTATEALLGLLLDVPEWAGEVRRFQADRASSGLIGIWSLPDAFAELRERLGDGGPPGAQALSFAGEDIVVAAHTGELKIWSVTGDLLKTLATPEEQATALTAAPTGEWFAVASGGGIRLREAATGALRFSLTGHSGRVGAIAATPEGGRLVSAATGDAVIVWDCTTGTALRTFATNGAEVRILTVSEDGGLVAGATLDGTVLVWELAGGSALPMLTLDDLPGVQAMRFGDDRLLLTLNLVKRRLILRAWDVLPGNEVSRLAVPCPSQAAPPAVLGNGFQVVAAHPGMEIKVWNAASQTSLGTFSGHKGAIAAIAVSAGGRLATAARDGEIRLWDLTSRRRQGFGPGHGGRAVAVVPGGGWFVAGGDHPVISVRDPRTRSVVVGIDAPGAVVCLAVSPDGDRIIAGGSDRRVHMWGLDGVHIGPDRQHGNTVRAVAVSPTGGWFASGDLDGVVRIWAEDPAASGRRPLVTGLEVVSSLAVSSDGGTLYAAGGDSAVRRWDTATWQRLPDFTGHDDWLRALAVSPGGRWLAGAGRDRDVRVWDTESGECVAVLSGHDDWVHTVAYSPDGSFLASGGRDRRVSVWQTATGTCVATMRVAGSVRSCAWLSNSDLVAVGAAGIVVLRLLQPVGDGSERA